MSKSLLLGLAAALIAAAGGYLYLNQPVSQTAQTEAPFMAALAQETGDTTETEAEAETGEAPEVIDMVQGEADAPITIVEYASFTCPHCATFHTNTYPQLRENYINTGQVRFILREVYFDRQGLWASMVARCGGEMRFHGLAELIFEDQREWVQGSPADVAANLRRIGLTAGLSEAQLDACLTDNAMAQAMVDTSTANAEADGITATPSFVINGEVHSNMSYAALSELLDGLLAEAQ